MARGILRAILIISHLVYLNKNKFLFNTKYFFLSDKAIIFVTVIKKQK